MRLVMIEASNDVFALHMPRASTLLLLLVGVLAGMVIVWLRRRGKRLDAEMAEQDAAAAAEQAAYEDDDDR